MTPTYIIKSNGMIKRNDGSYIPIDNGNSDYIEYIKWIKAGNKPTIEQSEIYSLTDSEMKVKSRRDAESYITKYFSTLELMDMLRRLTSSPNEKLNGINLWVNSIQTESITNYKNPNFNKFGNPPYSYEETF